MLSYINHVASLHSSHDGTACKPFIMDVSNLDTNHQCSVKDALIHIPKRHLNSEAGWEHQEIQEAKVGFSMPGNIVLLCKPRDNCIVAS